MGRQRSILVLGGPLEAWSAALASTVEARELRFATLHPCLKGAPGGLGALSHRICRLCLGPAVHIHTEKTGNTGLLNLHENIKDIQLNSITFFA